MNLFSVLIPAAGAASRMGINFPKTLIEINSQSIISRIINTFKAYDAQPSIIISRKFKKKISSHLISKNLKSELLYQPNPNGMGDAILRFRKSIKFKNTINLIIIWGDVPFISKSTVNSTIRKHLKNNNAFTFPTIKVHNPYTFIVRNKKKEIIEIIETHGSSQKKKYGERDIGFFVVNKKILFELINKNLEGKISKNNNEHGFLYIIKHFIKLGYKVEAISIAKKKDLHSINTHSDLKKAIKELKNC